MRLSLFIAGLAVAVCCVCLATNVSASNQYSFTEGDIVYPNKNGLGDDSWMESAACTVNSPRAVSGVLPWTDESLSYDYAKTVSVLFQNIGGRLVVNNPNDADSSVSIASGSGDANDVTYNLVGATIHYPAEHIINGTRYDAEIQLIHYAGAKTLDTDNFDDKDFTGSQLIVSVFVTVSGKVENSLLASLGFTEDSSSIVVDANNDNLRVVNKVKTSMPLEGVKNALESAKGYYSYKGHSTYGTCGKNVQYRLLLEPMRATKDQLDDLKSLVYFNSATNAQFSGLTETNSLVALNDTDTIVYQSTYDGSIDEIEMNAEEGDIGSEVPLAFAWFGAFLLLIAIAGAFVLPAKFRQARVEKANNMAILHSGKALTRSNKKISMNPKEMKMAVSAANKADAADAAEATLDETADAEDVHFHIKVHQDDDEDAASEEKTASIAEEKTASIAEE